MNFLRSILSEDPDPPLPDNSQNSPPESPRNPPQQPDNDDHHNHSDQAPPSSTTGIGGGWDFGGLIKTIATRSESVIETYRRDLKEFQSGLQKETEAFREAAGHVVKDLPGSIDGVWKSTAEIISHGKETLLAPSDSESDSSSLNLSNRGLSSSKYSRFNAQLQSIQSDLNTYYEEPEDLDDYAKWKLGFVLEDKSEEIRACVEENGNMEDIYNRVVPNVVDHETFWFRYFYKVDKLKQQENVRANLVKRAISTDMDEELTWDVEDEEDDNDDEESSGPLKGNEMGNKDLGSKKVSEVVMENKELGSEEVREVVKEGSGINEEEVGMSKIVEGNVGNVNEGSVVEISGKDEEQISEVNVGESVSVSDEKVDLEGKVDSVDSCKDSDVSIVSTQPSLPEEEDLGWDEIEDLGSVDGKKERNDGSPNISELRKRLSAADEDEDLNWDIEDDDDGAVSKPDSK
ncbi:hypothetical protein RHSIM_Rhsim13G0021700 [Rhododendron simsii]|uniref:BSD domain-containing protein n=1 Tax=Rhododendron simsii TaxID=118357 RepID=A0A834L6J2_RHOSS|nr:hypothetical protein RHSIM_Rhsim13G0021700 [Rhododendron simsii]